MVRLGGISLAFIPRMGEKNDEQSTNKSSVNLTFLICEMGRKPAPTS